MSNAFVRHPGESRDPGFLRPAGFSKTLLPVLVVIFLVAPIFAAPESIHLTLSQVENATFASSPKLKAAEEDFRSAEGRALAQRSYLSPKLSLEASYRYQDVVPELNPFPNAPGVRLGDNPNYSVGPQISWTAFSSGNNYERWKASVAAARSAHSTWDAARRQAQLEARTSYFTVRLGLEQVRVLADSLKLEESQYRDIRHKYQAGAVSRIDELSLHQQVLNRQRDLRQAQAELASSLHSLSAISGLLTDANLTIPIDAVAFSEAGDQTEPPTAVIEGDSLEDLAKAMNVTATREFDADHPNLVSLSESVESARRSAAALRSGYGPTIQLSAKVSRDYPNGPIPESFNQKTFGANASWPLFEGGRTPNESKAQEAQAQATQERHDQAARDLQRDFKSASDQLSALRYQDELNRTVVEENKTLSKLVYDAYRGGRSTYLEVENANLRLLQANVQSAQTKVEILMQVAVLDSLAKPLTDQGLPK